MNKFYFVILLLLACGCLSIVEGKKEEKNAVAKGNTNILEYIQLFKTLLNQALSKADLSSVRGVLSSPLSIGATAISVLLGGIVLMSFYESPLSPLPVPPLPQPPIGRFPPENPIVAPMNGAGGGGAMHSSMHGSMHHSPMHRSALHSLSSNPEQYIFSNENRRRMLYSPQSQSQQINYQKNPLFDYSSGANIKRSSSSDVYSYLNQMANQMGKNKFKSTNLNANMNGYAHLIDQPIYESKNNYDQNKPPQESVPSSDQQLNSRNDATKTDNLAVSSSNEHVSFAAPSSIYNLKTNLKTSPNPNTNNANSATNNVQFNNQLNDQLKIDQNPIYKQIEKNKSTERSEDKAFDADLYQGELVHSQLSQVNFKTSPELKKMEEKLSNRLSE